MPCQRSQFGHNAVYVLVSQRYEVVRFPPPPPLILAASQAPMVRLAVAPNPDIGNRLKL